MFCLFLFSSFRGLLPLVIARVARPVATLRLSREHNQTCLNYAEAEQGRPKVNLDFLTLYTLYKYTNYFADYQVFKQLFLTFFTLFFDLVYGPF